MTRGRQDNRVYVVTDAATKGHGYQIPPTPSELLPAVIRRSSAERSTTEPLRAELDRADDRELCRRLHDQAVTMIETGAGPNRRPELHGLQRLRASLPLLRDIVAVNHRISAQLRHLHCLQAERDGAAAELDRSRQRFTETERTVERIPEAQAAIARRRDWFLSHPAELAWEAELAARLGRHSTAVDPRAPERDDAPGDDLDAIFQAVDLRTIDLSPKRPATGIEQRLRKSLGIAPPAEPDFPLRPSPGSGIDGPGLGLGL